MGGIPQFSSHVKPGVSGQLVKGVARSWPFFIV